MNKIGLEPQGMEIKARLLTKNKLYIDSGQYKKRRFEYIHVSSLRDAFLFHYYYFFSTISFNINTQTNNINVLYVNTKQ